MGFTTGDTSVPWLTADQRNDLLGQCTDLSILGWALLVINSAPTRTHKPATPTSPDYTLVYTFNIHFLAATPQPQGDRAIPIRTTTSHPGHPNGRTPPAPELWTRKFTPEAWVYTNGSDIKGQTRLGAAVIHIPTRTTLYIDEAASEETRTAMRAALIAIYTALTRFHDHP